MGKERRLVAQPLSQIFLRQMSALVPVLMGLSEFRGEG
jgi:hypothetical protein